MRVRLLPAALSIAALMAVVMPTAPASGLSWTDVNSCTINPAAPVISGTSVAGKFTLNCTKLSTVAIEVTVGEWDPVVVSGRTSNTFFVPTDTTLALTPTVIYYTPAKAKTTYTITTGYKPCWNSETDKEEYGTRIRVMTNLSSTTKGWSGYQTTTAPKVNANTFAC
jgi:hypothetical protein